MTEVNKQKTKWRITHFIFAAFVIMATALMYVWFHIQTTKINYQIAQEIQNQTVILEENRRLKIEIATLKSPRRIEAIARTKLKMIYPTKDQVVFIK